MKTKTNSPQYPYLKSTLWERIVGFFREFFIDARILRMPFAKQGFWSYSVLFRLTRIPFLRNIMPECDPKRTDMTWLPINRDIESAGQVALPEDVLDRLIEKAKYLVLVNFCGCRTAMNCKHYSHDIGCLMMGESALAIPEKSRRVVSVEEAKAHVRKSIAAGLIPIAGKARLDNDIFMIPDRDKLLTVCFCCECCCILRYSRHMPAEVLDGLHHPVDGLSITVTDKCTGCGTCVEHCYIGAIKIENDSAVIGEMCRVCGRCSTNCPENAIKLKLGNSKAAEELVLRIDSIVEY
jgi:UDP-glucose 4-epimerase